jgi:hypothetical protein
MNKGLYALAGGAFALIVYSFLGPLFSGLAIGVVIGYSICDRGRRLAAVWAGLHPYIDLVFARLSLLAGLKPQDSDERDSSRVSGNEPSSSKVTRLKDARPTARRKRAE